jgi:UTP:GlnB (protein PII) uridylyltransferase
VPVRQGLIEERQQQALRLLRYFALPDSVHERLWKQLDVVYFLRHSAEEIAWHTRALHYRTASRNRWSRRASTRRAKGLEVMIYTRDQRDLFARVVGFFSRAGYTIVDAKIHTTRHGYALDSFMLLDLGDRGNDRDDDQLRRTRTDHTPQPPRSAGGPGQRTHLATGEALSDPAAGHHRAGRERLALRPFGERCRSSRPAVQHRHDPGRHMAPICTRQRFRRSANESRTPS